MFRIIKTLNARIYELKNNERRAIKKENESVPVEYRLHERERFLRTLIGNLPGVVYRCTVDEGFTSEFLSDGCREAEEERGKAQEEIAQLFMSEQTAHGEAKIARLGAERADRAKDEFLQLISHEFRTPLTTIKTLARIMQKDGETLVERQEYLETIATECDRQIDMILNLLDVARVEDRINGFRAGVDAYLVKPFEPEELVAVIENILSRVSRTHLRVARAGVNPSPTTETVQPASDLTEAEDRVAALVAKTLSNKEIAAHLGISRRTVEMHISRILHKKGFSNRVEIARFIIERDSAKQ